MAAKHFMIYYHRGTGTYVVTEPRPWARENQHYFPNYGFTNMKDDHPITHLIKNYCVRILKAQKISMLKYDIKKPHGSYHVAIIKIRKHVCVKT